MADMQTTLSLILQAKDDASRVLEQVGAQMQQLGQQADKLMARAPVGLKVERPDALRAALTQQLATITQGYDQQAALAKQRATQAEQTAREAAARRSAAEKQNLAAQLADQAQARAAELDAMQRGRREGDAAARAAATQDLQRSSQFRTQDLAALKEAMAEEKAVVLSAAEERRQKQYTITQKEMLQAALARDKDIKSAQKWAQEQQKILAQEQERQKALLSGPQAQVMFGDEQIRAIEEANAKANAVIAEQNKQGLARMVSDADAAYRASVNVAENALQRELDAITATETEGLRTVIELLAEGTEAVQTAYNKRNAAINDTLREAGEMSRQQYTDDVRAFEEAEAEKTDALKAHAAQNQATYQSEMEKAIQTSRSGLATLLENMQREKAQEVAAWRSAGEQEIAAAKQAAEAQRKAAQEASGGLSTLMGPLRELVGMGKQMLVWNTAYQLWGKMSDAATSFAGGLVSTNANVEQLSQTFGALYHTSALAGQGMVTALNTFAARVPATREQVQDAAVQFAAAGDNVQQIIQPASDLASIMGAQLPDAAHAMVDAQMGRFEMLQMTLKTTKEELLGYGLQIDGVGHVLNNSFVPAIERYTEAKFGEHLGLDAEKAHAVGEQFYFTAQNVKQFTDQLAVSAKSTAATDITHAASIAAGAMPAGTTEAERSAVLPKTLTDLTRAAQGNKTAITELHTLYGVLPQDLDAINKRWRDSPALMQQTFAAWLQTAYGGKKALQDVQAQQSASERQMHTLSGLFSNVQDAVENLQQAMGKGIFNALRANVGSFIDMLQTPAVVNFATQIGTDLGNALSTVIKDIDQWIAHMGGISGVIARVQTYIHAATQVFGGLWDTLHNMWSILTPLVQMLGNVASVLGFLTGAAGGSNTGLRTLVSTLLTGLVAWKTWNSGVNLVKDAFNKYNDAVKNVTKTLADNKAATIAAKEAKDAERAATDDATLSEEKNKIATDALKDSTVVATGATEKQTIALGESGLAGAATVAKEDVGAMTQSVKDNTAATVLNTERTEAETTALGASGLAGALTTAASNMKGLAVATGEAGAAGAMSVASRAATGFGSAITGLMGYLNTLQGKLIVVTGTLLALKGVWDEIQTFNQAKTNVAMVQQIDQALTPKNAAAYGHTLWQGPASGHGGAAYQMYSATVAGQNPGGFIQYLLTNPAAMKRYLQTMGKQSPWDEAHAQAAIQTWQQMQASGAAGLNVTPEQQQQAQNEQTYTAALNKFKADVHTKHWSLAVADLTAVQQAYQTYTQGSDTSQQGYENALNASDAMSNQLLQQIPQKYWPDVTGMPDAPSDSQTGDGKGGTTGTGSKAAKKALTTFVKQKWAKTLDALRAGTLTPSEVASVVQQYTDLETAAGQPTTDTQIQDQIRAAVKTHVTALISKFHQDLKLVSLGKISQQALQEEAARIQGTEASVSITDYHDYGQDVTNAFDKATKATAQKQIRALTTSYQIMWDRLKNHVKGVTVDMVNNVIAQIQQLEIGANLQDTTGMMTQRMQDWQQRQATTAGKTAAKSQLTDYIAQRSDDMAHFAADVKRKHYTDAAALIDTIVNDTEQIDKARHMGWNAILKDEDAVRTRLNARLPASVSAVAGGAAVRAPAALYGPYRPVAPQYGATQVSFGGPVQQPMQELVSQLRALATYWMTRARQDEQALALEQQTAGNTRSTASNTQGLAAQLNALVARLGYAPSSAPSNAGAALRGRGIHAPVPV